MSEVDTGYNITVLLYLHRKKKKNINERSQDLNVFVDYEDSPEFNLGKKWGSDMNNNTLLDHFQRGKHELFG